MTAQIKAFPLGRMVGRAHRAAHIWLHSPEQSRVHVRLELEEMTAALKAAGLGPCAIRTQIHAYNKLVCDEWSRHQPLLPKPSYGSGT